MNALDTVTGNQRELEASTGLLSDRFHQVAQLLMAMCSRLHPISLMEHVPRPRRCPPSRMQPGHPGPPARGGLGSCSTHSSRRLQTRRCARAPRPNSCCICIQRRASAMWVSRAKGWRDCNHPGPRHTGAGDPVQLMTCLHMGLLQVLFQCKLAASSPQKPSGSDTLAAYISR